MQESKKLKVSYKHEKMSRKIKPFYKISRKTQEIQRKMK